MITAVDSSVLLDVLLEDLLHRDSSLSALVAAHAAGVLVVCPVVWSEVRAALREPDRIGEHLGAAGIRFDPFDETCAGLAGDLWHAYRREGGKREHVIPDFLVGAHALAPASLTKQDSAGLRNAEEACQDGEELLGPPAPEAHPALEVADDEGSCRIAMADVAVAARERLRDLALHDVLRCRLGVAGVVGSSRCCGGILMARRCACVFNLPPWKQPRPAGVKLLRGEGAMPEVSGPVTSALEDQLPFAVVAFRGSFLAVGMNVLAPVAENGRRTPVISNGAFAGFRTREVTVRKPSDRAKAMGVITADHGFLLLDETTEVHPYGTKRDPERRHVLAAERRQEAGMVAVGLSELVRLSPVAITGWFAVKGRAGVVVSATRTATSESWQAGIADEGERKVLSHLARHGSITEQEATRLLGSPMAFRRFSRQFDELVQQVPFTAKVESTADGKRYVRDREK